MMMMTPPAHCAHTGSLEMSVQRSLLFPRILKNQRSLVVMSRSQMFVTHLTLQKTKVFQIRTAETSPSLFLQLLHIPTALYPFLSSITDLMRQDTGEETILN